MHYLFDGILMTACCYSMQEHCYLSIPLTHAKHNRAERLKSEGSHRARAGR